MFQKVTEATSNKNEISDSHYKALQMLEEVVLRIQRAYKTRYTKDKNHAFEGKGVICIAIYLA